MKQSHNVSVPLYRSCLPHSRNAHINESARKEKKRKKRRKKGDRSRITTGYRWSFRRCHVVYANYFSVTNHFLANCLSRDCYTSIRFGEASGPLESFDLLESTCAAIVRVTYWPIADNPCARARTHRETSSGLQVSETRAVN